MGTPPGARCSCTVTPTGTGHTSLHLHIPAGTLTAHARDDAVITHFRAEMDQFVPLYRFSVNKGFIVFENERENFVRNLCAGRVLWA